MNEIVFNGTFWLSLAGIIAGVLAAVFSIINKSKCKTVNCCGGLFSCIRDTEAETELEKERIEHNIPESPSKNNIG
jgi:hypothetical protein